MKHFNIDRVEIVENRAESTGFRFCYGDQNLLSIDFGSYNGPTAAYDLINKTCPSRFKRAVFLHKLLTTAKEKFISLHYNNYNPRQLANSGMATVSANHYVSFTVNLSVAKDEIVYKTTRFAHDEVHDLAAAVRHAQGQLDTIKDFQELLDEVNEELKVIGPKITKLFKDA